MLLGSATRLRGVSIVPYYSNFGGGLRYYTTDDFSQSFIPEIDDPLVTVGNNNKIIFSRNKYITHGSKSGDQYLLFSDRSGTKFDSYFIPFSIRCMSGFHSSLLIQDTNGNIWRSTDGGETLTNMALIEDQLQNFAYYNGVYVAAILQTETVGDNYGVYYSTDNGSNWTFATAGWGTGGYVREVMSDGSQFIGIGNLGLGGNARIVTSPDGENWTSRAVPSTDHILHKIIYQNGYYFLHAQNPNHEVWLSEDLDNWDLLSNPFGSGNFQRIEPLRNSILVVRQGSPVTFSITTDQGINWNTETADFNATSISIALNTLFASKHSRL